jgi:hypothetical protein
VESVKKDKVKIPEPTEADRLNWFTERWYAAYLEKPSAHYIDKFNEEYRRCVRYLRK